MLSFIVHGPFIAAWLAPAWCAQLIPSPLKAIGSRAVFLCWWMEVKTEVGQASRLPHY